MIKFELPDGTKGRVVFQHDRGTFPESATGTAGTDCELEIISPSGKVMRFLGSSTLHPGDKFDKEIGRKVSLARALACSGMSRDDRRHVWYAYHHRRENSVYVQSMVREHREHELDASLKGAWDEGHPACRCGKCMLRGLIREEQR